jgi:hypothetical protein
MAERRMFAKTIIDSDAFLEMPTTSQLLYFHLSMRADDDGFVNKPKSLMRMVGCKDDDLKLLFVKKFLIPFESGVVVIKHWKIHNYIRKDTYTETKYKEEKSTLELDENSAYRIAGESPLQLRDESVTSPSTQDRLGKERIGKDRLGEGSKGKKETTHDLLLRLLPEYIIPDPLSSKLVEWIAYKTERKETYKEVGLKSLLRQVENNQLTYGANAVCDLIDDSMANGWKGIIFDRLKQKVPVRSNQPKNSNPFLDMVGDGYE